MYGVGNFLQTNSQEMVASGKLEKGVLVQVLENSCELSRSLSQACSFKEQEATWLGTLAVPCNLPYNQQMVTCLH